MSQQNVEMVARAIEGFNRRDLDEATRDNDPEIEVDWSRSLGVEAGTYRGRASARRFWSRFFEMFEEIILSPDDFIDFGDHVVVPNRARFQGRDGVVVEARSALVATIRDGRFVRWTLFQDRAEALEAVGLPDQDAHLGS